MLNCYFFPSYLAIMRSNGTRALIVSYLQGYGTLQSGDPHANFAPIRLQVLNSFKLLLAAVITNY